MDLISELSWEISLLNVLPYHPGAVELIPWPNAVIKGIIVG